MSTAAFTNGYKQFSFADFSGGLNLRDKADAVGDRQAIDLLNVDFSEHGAIMQRDGFVDLIGGSLTNRVDSLSPFYKADGTRQLIAGCGTRLEAFASDGSPVANKTGLFGGPYNFVRFAAPGAEYLYAANGLDAPQRWDGAAWTVPTATVDGTGGRAMPKAGAFAVTAALAGSSSGNNASNRLIATAFGTAPNAGPNGAATNPSRWYASNPGQPETWETDGLGTPTRGRNYGDLTPGDGEQIMAAVTWRELIFVFKETKFFVLWGEGTAADGTPTFQWREVVNAVGLASKLAVTVGRDGVYFFNRRGVYRTNGGNPELLSDIISPLWTTVPAPYYLGSRLNLNRTDLVRMVWHQERLYVAVPTGSSTFNDRVLVYDTQHEWWSVYDLRASALAPFRSAPAVEWLTFGYASGSNRIAQLVPNITSDQGAAITSRWRSGWSDYGTSQVKTIRESRAWGTGEVVASFSTDYGIGHRANVVLPFTPQDAQWIYQVLSGRGGDYTQLKGTYADYDALDDNLGAAPVIGERMARVAVRGFVFSTQFANSPGSPSWSVHRVARNMREIREASIA